MGLPLRAEQRRQPTRLAELVAGRRLGLLDIERLNPAYRLGSTQTSEHRIRVSLEGIGRDARSERVEPRPFSRSVIHVRGLPLGRQKLGDSRKWLADDVGHYSIRAGVADDQ